MAGLLVHGNNREASHYTYFYRNERIGCTALIGSSDDTSHISFVCYYYYHYHYYCYYCSGLLWSALITSSPSLFNKYFYQSAVPLTIIMLCHTWSGNSLFLPYKKCIITCSSAVVQHARQIRTLILISDALAPRCVDAQECPCAGICIFAERFIEGNPLRHSNYCSLLQLIIRPFSAGSLHMPRSASHSQTSLRKLPLFKKFAIKFTPPRG